MKVSLWFLNKMWDKKRPNQKEEMNVQKRYTFEDLRDIIEQLRSENGCPWDKVQTHESLRADMLEEAYEAVDAIDKGDMDNLKEELGDVLMQVVFHSSIEAQKGGFTLDDVIQGICEKMVYRHPHVFGEISVDTAEQVLVNWEALKKKEKHMQTQTDVLKSVPDALPALTRAKKVQKKAADVGFDFYEAGGAMEKVAEEIREHMDRLEKEKRIRQEFFSNASHELKTPITSVRGYAELLDQGFVTDEAVKKDFIARILKETDNMTNLINDILMISRLEAKEAEVTYSTVRMVPLLTEIFESVEPIAAEYQVTLHKECEPVSIEASAKQLRELIMNLVSNGIKYNHPGGNVWVEISARGTDMCVRVRDDGCGIRKEDQDRIFERFYRVDKGRSKKMGGTGLGLSIVKHIAEYYNGHIELESEPGKGSCFTVTIPGNQTKS